MNTLHVIVLLFVASATAENNHKLIDPFFEVREKCLAEANMSHELLAKGPHVPDIITPFLICFGYSTGILTKDGEINREALIKASLQTVSENILVPTTNYCAAQMVITGLKTPGDKMLSMSNCFKNILGGELLGITGYCEPPSWRRLDEFYKKNAHAYAQKH